MNVITLTSTLHSAWNKGIFAFKPSLPSADGMKIELGIFFLDKMDKPARTNIPWTQSPPESPRYLDGLCEFRNEPSPSKQILSGDKIIITTEDPQRYTLSSYELLEMQWVLTRLTRMAGGAEARELDNEGDDNEGIAGRCDKWPC
ncbi:hypothetical protein F5884DRAFT_886538 [Xylogone sp. PMI_703]|nr:hypothetical protein F5884DRAFT_886538 [Xylogone sp. PMI_703]